MRLASAAGVFLAALLLLAYGAGRQRVGSGYLDPVGGIAAQDEAVYSHAALRMAERGRWLTPVFLDRFFLYKPPLVYWTSGLSASLLGPSAFALRLPAALAAALACLLVFLWARQPAPHTRALLAAALALSSPLFHNLARRNLTDALACLAVVAAASILHAQPRLAPRWAAPAFGAAVALATLAKSVAGLLPLAILSLYFLAARSDTRPRLTRIAVAAGVAAVLALPWFAYQYLEHPRWFWAEFVQVELLAYGASAPPQTSAESHAAFYLKRLWTTDPWLSIAALAALPFFAWRLRRRQPPELVLGAWIAVLAAGILLFQYRNATYLMPLLPALALLAGIYAPLPAGRSWPAAVAAVALVAAKCAMPSAPWSLNYSPVNTIELAPLAERYCELGRATDLVVVSAEDEFYSTVLPLPRVRYALEGTGQPPPGFALNFREIGVVVSVDEFLDMARARSLYAPRLHQWGLPDDHAFATVIALPSGDDLARLVRHSPDSDFLIPARLRYQLSGFPHAAEQDQKGNLLLLARSAQPRSPPRRSCRL